MDVMEWTVNEALRAALEPALEAKHR